MYQIINMMFFFMALGTAVSSIGVLLWRENTFGEKLTLLLCLVLNSVFTFYLLQQLSGK